MRLSHPCCKFHLDSPPVPDLDLDTSFQEDNSGNWLHCLHLSTDKYRRDKGRILTAPVLSTELPQDKVDMQGFLMVHRYHFDTEQDLHLDQHN